MSIRLDEIKTGPSGIWSDKVSIEQKKTAEHFVYLNNHKQIYNNTAVFYIMHGGFTALNVQERSTKVIQLFFMSKQKASKE
ncbi:hypothetical protein [Prevotella sp.]|uniref:hypothetical protein n=1 Tax=Prevotella sp. TaxID=59823 RepID=UPI00402972DA